MAMIFCSECYKTISYKAESCPNCGAPIISDEKKLADEAADKEATGCAFGCLFIILILFGIIAWIFYITPNDLSVPTDNRYNSTNSVSTSQKEAVKETTALIINVSGYLCAKVVDIRPLTLKDRFEVTCIEYRGGSSTKTYIYDAVSGDVTPQ